MNDAVIIAVGKPNLIDVNELLLLAVKEAGKSEVGGSEYLGTTDCGSVYHFSIMRIKRKPPSSRG